MVAAPRRLVTDEDIHAAGARVCDAWKDSEPMTPAQAERVAPYVIGSIGELAAKDGAEEHVPAA